jgi:hypothetical protein
MSSGDDCVVLTVGFGAGLFLFGKGFCVFREYRVLADTPEIPIRSMAMGLVEIHGKAKGEELLTSPVTRSPCYLYKVEIERWQTDSKGRGSWHHYRTDVNGVKFYVEDATGRVQVDPTDAELDMLRTCRREIFGRKGTGWKWLLGRRPAATPVSANAPTDVELGDYVSSAATGSPPRAPVRVSPSDSAEVRAAKARMASPQGLDFLKQIALGANPLFAGRGSASGRYRLTEYCILPNHWYDVTGTCTENPHPQDEHDRNKIVKGENEPTFLISWRSEREIEGALRRRAALYIFGGAALSVICLALLLSKLGWL